MRINFKKNILIKLILVLLFVQTSLAMENTPVVKIEKAADMTADIVDVIKVLEQEKDPKCYATASRLEDFMFGTPLSKKARFSKNLLQKSWAKNIWNEASKIARNQKQPQISVNILNQVINQNFNVNLDEKKHWRIHYKTGQSLSINKQDKRQYSTIAYSLRAILAVQQESLFDLDSQLLPLNKKAINQLKDALDLLSLSALKISDTRARNKNDYEVSLSLFNNVWNYLVNGKKNNNSMNIKRNIKSKIKVNGIVKNTDLFLIKKIIKQKISSYKVYNKISNQLFVRNLQVYFARLSWPKDQQKGAEFKRLFVETMIQFSYDLYKQSEKIALSKGHSYILEEDVNQLIQSIMPHEINQYEDAIFFPKLKNNQKVSLESYDLDAFRDSGIHWRYLEFALDEPSFKAQLQPDPFALELMVENIAQFGVLSLRMAGEIGKKKHKNRMETSFYLESLKMILTRVALNNQQPSTVVNNKGLLSSSTNKIELSVSETDTNKKLFKDITQTVGINSMHRSSDWLNRLLRSYLEKSETVGIITIPPAFGGSGIAAEDINNDGFIDLLILSGLGNKLYLNQNGESFKDITEESGISWKRSSDHTFAEPRQPIIADLDNDGLQDIVITYVNDQHKVFKNIGNAKFIDVSNIALLGGKGLVGGPATVADFDNDGLLDLYITYFGHYTKGILPTLKRINNNGLPNQLFKNMGGFKFKNITKESGVGDTGWAQAVTHTDFNGDGLQDIIVGNDFGTNIYFKNQLNGKFKNVSKNLGTDKPSYTMNIGIADLNQDLKPDFYISNIVTMNKDEKYVLPSENTSMKFNANKLATMRVIEANDLFLSNADVHGDVEYKLSKAVGRGYSSTGWSWDADFFDFDNDGDEDLYVLNGMNEFNLYSSENPYYTDPLTNKKENVYIPVSTKESNVFFINDNGKLVNESKQSGVDLVGNSRSATYLDFDHDGDLDIAINNYHESAVFYENKLSNNDSHQSTNSWIKIKLVGDISKKVNRDAIGAIIIITLANKQTLWREIHGTTGYMSVHPKIQHFGLADQAIQAIEIIWPNKQRQWIKKIKKNHQYIITQNSGIKMIERENQ